MGFRFHRSKKLFPGLRLNFSKNGFGLSFGRKGMRYSIGPKGTRTTLGIPGTGLSYISTSSGTGGSSATGPVVSSAGVFSDIDCDADLLLGDPVFYDLGRMSDTEPKRAVMIYNSVVGFVKDDAERRIFRETGDHDGAYGIHRSEAGGRFRHYRSPRKRHRSGKCQDESAHRGADQGKCRQNRRYGFPFHKGQGAHRRKQFCENVCHQ